MVNFKNKIASLIDQDLQKIGEKEFARRRNRLLGKRVLSYGVRVSEIRKIVKKYRNEFLELRKEKNCFKIGRELISKKVFDDQIAGIFLIGLCKGIKTVSKIKKLIVKYVNNWAVCDAISTEVVAKILKDSKEMKILYSWIQSDNEWLRRSVLVTTIKLKNKIPDWKIFASRILIFSKKEKNPIVKKAVYWLRKTFKNFGP